MIFVGIDPGKHGAVAWMDGTRKLVGVQDTPLRGDAYDFHGMFLALRMLDDSLTGMENLVVTMEAVHSMPTDGKCSAFTFGVGYGAWLGVLGALDVTPRLVSPQTWKRTMLAGVPNDKAAEAKALKQRFQGHEICSQLHGPRGGLRDGRVDALLLAEYGRLAWKLSGKVAA